MFTKTSSLLSHHKPFSPRGLLLPPRPGLRSACWVILEEADDAPAADLLAIEGMDEATAFALAANGVRTSEDLSDLAADEILEFGIENMDQARAAALILAARAEEIARLERGQ